MTYLPEQFSYTSPLSEYKVVVTFVSDRCHHWQVIRQSDNRVMAQGTASGKGSRHDALQCGLDVVAILRGES